MKKRRENAVEHRIKLEALERDWLTGLFLSVGKESAGAETLAARTRERRMVRLRKRPVQ